MSTIDDLRAWSVIDPATHCWHWQRAVGPDSVPRIHTLDYRRGEKRVMSGPAAVWSIAHSEAPRGVVYRACGCRDCVNPAHHRLARDTAEVMHLVGLSGRMRGTHTEMRRANLRLARAAAGHVDTPVDKVRAIRAADASVTGRALARSLGLSESVVSRIRRGETQREVQP